MISMSIQHPLHVLLYELIPYPPIYVMSLAIMVISYNLWSISELYFIFKSNDTVLRGLYCISTPILPNIISEHLGFSTGVSWTKGHTALSPPPYSIGWYSQADVLFVMIFFVS